MRNKKVIKARIIFQIAECYRMIDDPKQEEQWYSKALKAKCADSIAAKQYMEAATKKMGYYDTPRQEYKQYAKPQGNYDSAVPKHK